MRIELRFLFVLLLVNVLTLSVSAVEVDGVVKVTIADEIESKSQGQISFYQPENLNKRLVKVETDTTAVNDISHKDSYVSNKTVGFRVQVYTNSNQMSGKSGALSRERDLLEAFPDLSTHLVFSAPYWRLRVGDFKIKEEAMLYMQQIQNEFPDFANEVRIVKDYITEDYND